MRFLKHSIHPRARITAALLSLALLLVPFAASVTAEEAKPENNSIPLSADTFFPDGMIAAPETAPYAVYSDTYITGTYRNGEVRIYYDVPDELIALANTLSEIDRETFGKKTGMLLDSSVFVQIDVKFDDGAWLSENGNWDALDYGEGLSCVDSAFRLRNNHWLDDTGRMYYFRQADLSQLLPESAAATLLTPYITAGENAVGEPVTLLDLTNHTLAYRYRFYIPYQIPGQESEFDNLLFSPWSPETSIGKDGSQQALKMPESVEAPVLSDFRLLEGEEETFAGAEYLLTIPQSVYDGEKYFLATEELSETYRIETQLRIDGGEWKDVDTVNGTWINNSRRTIDFAETLTVENDIELRQRLVCSALGDTASEWSEPVGVVREKAETTAAPTTEPTEAAEPTEPTGQAVVNRPTSGCSLCGKCPMQPLGICLYIWLVIILCLIALVLLVLRKARNTRPW